jgi:CRP/FNR family transcriptional regulator, anaerobic regulatory protein
MSVAVAWTGMARTPAPVTYSKSHQCETCGARTLSICAAMRPEDFGKLAVAKTFQRVAAGATFLNEGDAATHFFNITEGSVKVYKLMPDGRRQVTGFLFVGDLLGLAFNDTYTYSAEALTPVTMCRFPRRHLERMLDEYPKLERRLLAIASNELAAAQEQMMLLGRKTAHERIASFLLMLARREERLGRSPDMLRLTMTRTDIADYLGLTTETVSRVFTSLRKRGCIDLESGSEVSLIGRGALEDLANGLEERV